MNKRPLSITIIGWIFIAVGGLALLFSLPSILNTPAANRLADLRAHWMIPVSRMAALLSGVFILYGRNWARWLLVVWLAFHVIVGALHSTVQVVTHSLLFLVVVYFLFRPPASAYFRREV